MRGDTFLKKCPPFPHSKSLDEISKNARRFVRRASFFIIGDMIGHCAL